MCKISRFTFGIALLVFALLSFDRSCLADPISSIASPSDCQDITGPVTVTGTASDSSSSIQKVLVSVNGSDLRRATDTSGNGSWSTWSYTFTPRIQGAYHVQSVAMNVNSVLESIGPSIWVGGVLPAPGSISGTVSYSGNAFGTYSGVALGKVYVAVFPTPDMGGGGDPVAMAGPISGAGPSYSYTINNVPAGTWYIGAVKTLSTNNIQLTDPYGYYGGATPMAVTVTPDQATTSVDITLNDTTQNPYVKLTRVEAEFFDWYSMNIGFEYYGDPSHLASGVTVTGPGIVTPVTLAWDSGNNAWDTWQNQSGLNLGTDRTQWPTLPATFTFGVTGTGAGTYYATLNSYMTDPISVGSPKIVPFCSPSYPSAADVYGTLKFLWAPLPAATSYELNLMDNNNPPNQIWNKDKITADSSYVYGGPALTDGATYNFNITANDKYGDRSSSGGTFVYHSTSDTTAPTSAISSPAGGDIINNSTVTVTGTAGDDAGGDGVRQVKVSLDGGTIWYGAQDTSGNCSWSTWSFTFTPAASGSYTIQSKATDQAFNQESPAGPVTFTVNLPAPPPTSAITSPLNGAVIKNSTVNVTGTTSGGSGGVAKVEVSVNGGNWYPATLAGDGSWSYNLTVHASGVYDIRSRATDNMAQVETPGNAVHVLVSIPLHSISGTTSYTGTKAGSIYVGVFPDSSLSGDTVASVGPIAVGAYTVANVPDGTYYVGSVKAAASSGGGPDIQPTSPFGYYNGGASPAQVVLSGSNDTGINITLKDTTNNPLAGKGESSAWAEATYYDSTITGSGNDMQIEFGYRDPSHLASSVSVTGPGLGGTPVTQPLYWDQNNGQWSSWDPNSQTNPPTTSIIHLGSDQTQWPSMPATYTFTVNLNAGGTVTPAPASTLNQYMTDFATNLQPSGGQDVTGTVIFSWALVPSATVYQIQLNDGSGFWWNSQGKLKTNTFTYNSSTPGYTPLTDGKTYYYTVQAGGSNNCYASTQQSFVYHASTGDITPPTATIKYPATGGSVGGATCTITGIASDNVGVQRVEISFDSGTSWIPAYDTSGDGSWSTWSFNWPLAAAGSYTVKARAVDTSNNVQTTLSSVTVTVIVDHTAPTATFTYPTNGACIKTLTPTITGTTTDGTGGTGVAAVWFSPDNGVDWRGPADGVTDTSTTHNWSTWSYPGHAPGDLVTTLLCYAVDKAGNVQSTPTAITVTIDTTAPSSSIASPSGGDILKGTSCTISGTAGDATSGVAKVEISTNNGSTWTALPASATADNWAHWSYTWTLPADGLYTIKSRATDKAGNVETPGAGVSVRVDKTAPASAITPLASSTTKNSSVTITGTASDAGSGVAQVDISTDGGTTWTPVTSGTTAWTYTWTADDGPYSIKSRATDNAGNVENAATKAAVALYVDTTPPVPVIDTPLDTAMVSTATCAIKGRASDTGKGVTKVELSINGGAWVLATGTTSWSYTWTIPGYAPDSSCPIIARATDGAGNTNTATVTVTVNKAYPTSAITAPVMNANLKGTAFPYTIKGTAAGGVSTSGTAYTVTGVEVSVDGGGWTTVTSGTTAWTYAWTPVPADGPHSIISRATNSAGNVEDADPTYKAVIAVMVDTQAPSSTITSPLPIAPSANAIVKGTSCIITGTAGDSLSGVAKVEISTNGGTAWTALPAAATTDNWAHWTYTWTLPADGLYTIKTRATDKAGNIETPGAGVSVRVDKTAPTATITSPLTGLAMPGALSSYSIKGKAADAGSGVQAVQVSTDGGITWKQPADGVTDTSGNGSWSSWSYNWSPVLDGSYTLKVKATDVAGNTCAVVTGPTVKVDRTPPTAVITTSLSGVIPPGTSKIITGTAADGTGSGIMLVQVSTDGGGSWANATGTTSWSYTWTLPTSDSSRTIMAQVTDKSGNVFTTPGVTVTVDQKPVSHITSPTTGAAINAPITIAGTASDGAGTVTKVEVSTNGGTTWTSAGVTDTSGDGTWSTWSYSWATLPANGSYTIKSRATDNTGIGYVETPGAGVTVKVDTTPPVAVISTPALNAFVGATMTVTGTATDNLTGISKVEVSIDGGSHWLPAAGTASWSCAGIDVSSVILSDGPFTILARATDGAGNLQTTLASRVVKADLTGPTVAVTAPANGATITTSTYTIKGTALDGTGSGVKTVQVGITPDGGTTTWHAAAGTASWSYAWTVPANGLYTVAVTATDNSGNVSTTSVPVTVSR